MIYRKTYKISQKEWKEKFSGKTVDPTCRNLVQTAWGEDTEKRAYFGKLENCRFDLYSRPDMRGPWFSKPWFFPWRGMAMWAAPAHAYGTLYGTPEEAVIDFCITKSKWVKRFLTIAFIMSLLGALPLIFTGIPSGLAGSVMIAEDLLFLSIWIATAWIPETEKEALIKFLKDLDEENIPES